MYFITEQEKWRNKLAFAWFPVKTNDIGWVWLVPYVKRQRFVVAVELFGPLGEEVRIWKTKLKLACI